MKILVERDNFEKVEIGDIVQTDIGAFMKIYAGYLSLEGDSIGMIYYDSDFTSCKLLIKSEDVVISKAEKEEIYEVEKVKETKDNSKTKYKDELFISKGFIKFLGKICGEDVKEIFKVDDSPIKDCLDDLLYGIYKIYYNHKDKLNDDEFMVNELKNMIHDFFNSYDKKVKRAYVMLSDCIDYFKNLKKEDILNVYCTLSKGHYFGSLEEITYYFNKIGRLVEIGKIEYFHDNVK
ncbi:MAG: hypothetical protein ACI3T9_07975 [Romboutsia timonensis]